MPSLKNLDAHLFVCTHLRDGAGGPVKESCALKGSLELRDRLKAVCAEPRHAAWRGRMRVNASGCLDRCSEGIAAVIYPQGKWLTGLTRDSIDEVEQALSEILDQQSGERPGN